MITVFPDYYESFKCIAGKCRHNCCIGWEIDIDHDTLSRYQSTKGDLGKRLKESISLEDTPHFINDKENRCPFLNNENLCDIIISSGEENLCSICSEHPRFYCHLPQRVEVGLGLSCEEAARIILGKTTKTTLLNTPENEEDEIILIRDKIIDILQNRSLSISSRCENALEFFDIKMPDVSISNWAELLLSLERLDEKWTKLLENLISSCEKADFKGFDTYMQNRSHEYEQLLVYLVYRRMAVSPTTEEAGLRLAFAVLIFNLIYTLGALEFTENKSFPFESQVELCRLFSSEIEYSDENTEIILDAIWKYIG